MEAINAKKLNITPETVKRCTKYDGKVFKVTKTLTYQAFFPSFHVTCLLLEVVLQLP